MKNDVPSTPIKHEEGEDRKTIDHNGIKVLGPENLPSDIPVHASEMLSRNVLTFLQGLINDGKLNIDLTDEVLKDTLLTKDGQIENSRVRELLGLPSFKPSDDTAEPALESATTAGTNGSSTD